MEHEAVVIRAFIVPERRARYLDRLLSPKGRRKFMKRNFPHMNDLDPRYAQKIDPRRQHAPQIYELLRDRGAPEACYVMSATADLDGQRVGLREALEDVVGWHDGTFISCIPGKLAYFEGEDPNERYILER